MLDHIKRLENEIKVLKEKNKVVEEDTTQYGFKDSPHMHDEGHTEKDVAVDTDPSVESLNKVVDDKVPMNTDDKGKSESFFKVVIDEVQMNTNARDNDNVGSNSEKGKEMIVYNPKSSIVKTVQRRTDRLKKKKHPDYMTPPSTVPKRKSKRHLTQVVDEVVSVNIFYNACIYFIYLTSIVVFNFLIEFCISILCCFYIG